MIKDEFGLDLFKAESHSTSTAFFWNWFTGFRVETVLYPANPMSKLWVSMPMVIEIQLPERTYWPQSQR